MSCLGAERMVEWVWMCPHMCLCECVYVSVLPVCSPTWMFLSVYLPTWMCASLCVWALSACATVTGCVHLWGCVYVYLLPVCLYGLWVFCCVSWLSHLCSGPKSLNCQCTRMSLCYQCVFTPYLKVFVCLFKSKLFSSLCYSFHTLSLILSLTLSLMLSAIPLFFSLSLTLSLSLSLLSLFPSLIFSLVSI